MPNNFLRPITPQSCKTRIIYWTSTTIKASWHTMAAPSKEWNKLHRKLNHSASKPFNIKLITRMFNKAPSKEVCLFSSLEPFVWIINLHSNSHKFLMCARMVKEAFIVIMTSSVSWCEWFVWVFIIWHFTLTF